MSTIGAVQKVQSTGIYSVDGASAAGASHGDATPTSLLPPPALTAMSMSGDPVSELAALLVMSGNQQRTEARKEAVQEDQTMTKEGEAKVQSMHDKAHEIAVGGWWAGLGEVAMGASTIVSAAVAGPDPKSPSKLSQYISGGGKAAEGIGTIGSKVSASDQAHEDATIEEHGNAASAAERRYKIAQDDAADARDFIKKATEWFSEMKHAQDGAMQAALHRV